MANYTVDDYQIRKQGLDWVIFKLKDVKSKDGTIRKDWVHTGTYHWTFGAALGKLYEHLLADGNDNAEGVKEIHDKVMKTYEKIKKVKANE